MAKSKGDDIVTNNNARSILRVMSILSQWIIFISPILFIFFPVAGAAGYSNSSSSNSDVGIVGWINVGRNIDLIQAGKLFKTIDFEDKNEIFGTYTIYVNGYDTEDINLYITSNGLIASYYWSNEPPSKIISWNDDKTIFSKFATSISTVGQSLGYNIDYKNINYYDYRYPDANRMMIATQSAGESYIGNYIYGSLNFNIPGKATVYDVSYSSYLNDYNYGGSNIAIDSGIMDSMTSNGVIYNSYYGYISKDSDHLLGVMSGQSAQSGVALIIIYKDDNDINQNNPTIIVTGADNSFDGTLVNPELMQTRPSSTYISTPVATPRRTTQIPLEMPTIQPTERVIEQTRSNNPTPTQAPLAPSSASINLYGERTNVEMGQNILLKGSAVNYITKPKMHAQIIIIPPSGMSVVSADFVKSPAGQFTSDFEVDPGKGKDIEVTIIPNEPGEYKVTGKIIYYFGDDKNTGEYHDLNLPIIVRTKGSGSSTGGNEGQSTQSGNIGDAPTKTPGFELILGIIILVVSDLYIRKK